MSLPGTTGAAAPEPALFAAQCWWDGFDRWQAVEAGTVADGTVAEIDAALRTREADMRLVPGLGDAFSTASEETERLGGRRE